MKKNKNKKTIKVRDLKPKKDAKGGGPLHQTGTQTGTQTGSQIGNQHAGW